MRHLASRLQLSARGTSSGAVALGDRLPPRRRRQGLHALRVPSEPATALAVTASSTPSADDSVAVGPAGQRRRRRRRVVLRTRRTAPHDHEVRVTAAARRRIDIDDVGFSPIAAPDADITGGPPATSRPPTRRSRSPATRPADVLLQARRSAVRGRAARRSRFSGLAAGQHTFRSSARDRWGDERRQPGRRERGPSRRPRRPTATATGRRRARQLPGRRERGPGRRGQGRRRRRLRGAPVRDDAGRGRQGRDREAARRRGVRQAAARRERERVHDRPARAVPEQRVRVAEGRRRRADGLDARHPQPARSRSPPPSTASARAAAGRPSARPGSARASSRSARRARSARRRRRRRSRRARS